MTREKIRDIIATSVGDPSSGPVAEVIDTITDALDAALNPKPDTKTKTKATPED